MKTLRLLAASLALVALSAFSAPFAPLDTTNLAVTGTAQNLTLSTERVANTFQRQVVLTNIGTQTVFFRHDGTTATVANGMPLIANSQVVLTLPYSTNALSAIAGAVGSTLYATVGAGE